MQRIMLKSKIHKATLTGTELDYEGSIAIDQDLLDAADMLSGEQVQVLLTTSSGWLAHAGMISVQGERAEFSLRTVDHPAAVPIESESIYESGDLQLRLAHHGEPRRNQLVPKPRQQ